MIKLFKSIFILTISILLVSCNQSKDVASNGKWQKRKYTKGWHIATSKIENHKSPSFEFYDTDSITKSLVSQTTQKSSIEQQSNSILASNNKVLSSNISAKVNNEISDNGECSTIYFRNGATQKGKVIEISDTEIRYKKCTNLDGPTYVEKKINISRIEYANGSIDEFEGAFYNETETFEEPQQSYKEYEPMAIVSFILGITTYVISWIPIIGFLALGTALAAVILGKLSMNKIDALPERFKGRGMAFAGQLLGKIFLYILAALFILLLLILLSL